MGALGGIIDTGRRTVDPDMILGMSRAMISDGIDQRGAYLNRGVGVFHNGRLISDSPTPRQPISVTKDGKNYTLVCEGQILGLEPILSPFSTVDHHSPAEMMLEAYLAFGAEFVGSLQGSFSLAICDEAREEVLLARDRDGSRPLFYTVNGDTLAFASEIKALLRCLPDTAAIHTARFRAHITESCGAYRGEDLYRDIRAIPAGHVGIFSHAGMIVSPYEAISCGSDPAASPPPSIPCEFYCPDRRTLQVHLTEALFAFDYPQFDPWMSGFLRTLEQIPNEKKEHPLWIEDTTLFMSIDYARERADRLGSLRNTLVHSATPTERFLRPRELKTMDQRLEELLRDMDSPVLCRLFGKDWRDLPEQEKNVEKRIRMRGLLYQACLWFQGYPIRLL